MVSLTPAAARHIRESLQSRGLGDVSLKLQVVGGGCEGFLYDLLFVDAPDSTDAVFESQGLEVYVDKRALPVVNGLTIDHGATQYGTGFVFDNPSARSRCSCGASFGT